MRVNNKDILIGYIQTLTDKECRDIYYGLIDKDVKPYDYLMFGNVRLTQGQYNKLIWSWGNDKTNECIDILNKWLSNKELRNKYVSHYRMMLGWVENAYYNTHPAIDKSIKYRMKIDTAWKAKKYVQNIPPELRAYDSEVKFLVDKFGADILK